MVQPKINLYVDVVSPFGYLAFHMLRNSPTFKPVKLTYTPILLGGLHKQCNNTAPIFVKNKAEYIGKERDRWARLFNIPLRDGAPNGFPVSTVNAMRVLVAVQLEKEGAGNNDGGSSDDEFARCLEVLWSAVWCPEAKCLAGLTGKNEKTGEWDFKDPNALKTLLGSVLGQERASKVVGRIGDKDVKDRLMANTTRSFEKGAFGLPWFECVNEKGEEDGFFGFGHIGLVVRFLGLEGDGDRARSGEGLRALL